MPSPSPTINPITNPNEWSYFVLSGIQSPGTIPRGGIKGFKRPVGWDDKAGKGTQGATLTLKSFPPARGTITLQFLTAADFAAWDSFVSLVLSTPPTSQNAQGLTIDHPALSSVGVTMVVVGHPGEEGGWSPPVDQGRGIYHVDIDFTEWQQPPASSVVATVDSAASEQDDGSDVVPVDPRITQAQNQIDAYNRASDAGEP